MPLIVLCGIPGSGKTRRALEVKEFLEVKHACKVILINEEFLQLQKKEAYKGTWSCLRRHFIKK